MSDTNNIFKKTVQMLNNNNINYWICHGTLLGIIRNKSLLSWDHDIDFAVWEDEHPKEEILKIFLPSDDFKQEISLDEMNSLHFETRDKRIDINFYSRDKEKSYIKWAILKEDTFKNFYYFKILYFFVISFLINDVSFKKLIKSSNNQIFKIIKLLISIPLIIIRQFLSKKFKKKILKQAYKKFDIMGYSYPLDLMEFKEIEFIGIRIRVPKEPEEVLKFTYGKDWKIPKKNFVWYKEAKNLYIQDRK